MAQRQLLEARSPAPGRAAGQTRLDEQLVRLERRREVARRRGRPRGSSRRPRGDSATTDPPSATSASGSSAAASACAIEPPTVPRFRVATWPTKGRHAASSGQRSRASGERSSARWRHVAPDAERGRSPRRSPSRPGDAVDVDERAPAAAIRMFSMGTKLWPPASTFASGPPSASSADRLLDALRAPVLEGRRASPERLPDPRRPSAAARPSSTPSASATAFGERGRSAHRRSLAEALGAQRA